MERLGKYEIRAVLGRGAMGTVYEAWDPVISRRVAIKTVRLPDAGDSEERELLGRFKLEAQAAGRLHHANVVGVFDYAETDEIAYIVMEFVDGRTLKAMLDTDGQMNRTEIGRVMDGLLAGLAYSHGQGVIHRDIKPANVIITASGQVKIADFGIARIESSTMTQAGTIMGTPAYMSPEQFQGVAIDQRTDLYSAGVVLFQLLTGKRPFEGGMATIMQAVLTKPTPRPSEVQAGIPAVLDAVVARAMARAPADRFASATAFATALQAALTAAGQGHGQGHDDDATVIAPMRPTARGVLASRRRSRLPWALTAALLIVGSSGAYWALRPAAPPVVLADGTPGDVAPLTTPLPAAPIKPPVAAPVLEAAPVPAPLQPGALSAALGSLPCTLVTADRPGPEPRAITLHGVMGHDRESALSDALQRAAPGISFDIQTAVAEGPYCPLLDLLRRYAQPAGQLPMVALPGGRTDLMEDELVRPRVTLPGTPSHLQLDYIASDGGVLHMQESKPGAIYPALATPVFGEPRPGFTGWGVYLPFGTDLIVAVASGVPLFAPGHALPNTIDAYVTELRTALEQAGRAGPVVTSVLLVRTAPKR